MPVTVVATATVMALDLLAPTGVAVGMLYAPCVFLTIFARKAYVTAWTAGVCSGLVVVGYWLSPAIAVSWWLPVANRTMALLVIWITVVLIRAHLRSTRRVARLEKMLTMCAWTKQVRLDGRWVPIEEFLTRLLDVKISHGMTPEVARKLAEEGDALLDEKEKED